MGQVTIFIVAPVEEATFLRWGEGEIRRVRVKEGWRSVGFVCFFFRNPELLTCI